MTSPTGSRILGPSERSVSSPNPTLLTPEEAAAIARCSIKTVRRAYASGALIAYRRGGSRAVLLDNKDVLAWAQGEILEPTVPRTKSPMSLVSRSEKRGLSDTVKQAASISKLGSQRRFDLSADAVHDRRNSKTHASA
jgi:excisionase family DNA binding protein